MSVHKLHVWTAYVHLFQCMYALLEYEFRDRGTCVYVCVIPTSSIEEIFDLQAEQRKRNACFTVCLSSYRLQPKHIVIQRLRQRLSWI